MVTQELEPALSKMDDFAKTLDPESNEYWIYHRKRIAWTMNRLSHLRAECDFHGWSFARILDVGNSFQTLLMEELFPDCRLDTLGFFTERYRIKKPSAHLEFDLNDAYYLDRWPTIPPDKRYDVIVFLEVLEHLYTSPTQVLAFLKTLLNPGGFVVIGTPNAVALKKRFELFRGRNPYEMIREWRKNPGHFREYTLDELCHLGHQSGFEIRDWDISNFYRSGATIHRVLDHLSDVLPPRFRNGITIVFRAIA